MENRFEPGPVALAAGIAAYQYSADLDDTALTLALFEAGGDGPDLQIDEMTVEQVFGDDVLADGTMRATLGDAELTTRGAVLADGGERVVATVRRGAQAITVEVDLRLKPCLQSSPDQHCAGALELGADHVLLPTCGLTYDHHLRAGRAPTVVGLRYLVAAADAQGAGSGVAVREGQRMVTVEVLSAGEPRAADEVAAEIDAVGGPLSALLADDDVRRLAVVFFDRSWRRTLELHAATCIAEGAFDITGAPEVVSALSSGSNASRDTGSWSSNSNSSSSGGGRAWGDPHLVTFDGAAYDFQAAGDFLLAASSGEGLSDLEVQARFQPSDGGPVICRDVTWCEGAVVATAGHVFEVGRSGRLLIDGTELGADAPAVIDALDLEGAEVTLSGNDLSVTTSDGTQVQVSGGGYLNITVVPSDARAGSFIGLLGDADGDETQRPQAPIV